MYPIFSTEEVSLVPAPAKWIPRSNVRAPKVATDENSWEVKKTFGIIPAHEGSPISIVQHTMPAHKAQFDVPDGPFVAQLPMKGTESPFRPGVVIRGVRSGRRSSIVAASHKMGAVDWIIGYEEDGTPIYPNEEEPEFYIKLKGNGMWLKSEPFPFPGITLASLPSVHFPDVDTIEIRGTAFPDTCASEMWIGPKIVDMLKRIGLVHINTPLGIWYYGPMENDPAPAIPKCCSVFKILSDRRLETNVFAGIEKWMYSNIPESMMHEAYGKIAKLYTDKSMRPPSIENPSYIRIQKLRKFCTNEHMVKMFNKTDSFDEPSWNDERVESMGFIPSPDIYKALEGLEYNGISMVNIAKLWGRLAWEAGRCTACVHRAGYNWGSYQDHSGDAILANCHSNNISIIPEEKTDLGDGKYQLLSPLDFDMSFAKEQAVSVWDSFPAPEQKLVTEMFSCEFGNMLLNLTGYTAALEGVATGIWKRDPEPCIALEFIYCLRDICAWEFRYGYMRPSDPSWEGNNLPLKDALEIIKLGINLTLPSAP